MLSNFIHRETKARWGVTKGPRSRLAPCRWLQSSCSRAVVAPHSGCVADRGFRASLPKPRARQGQGRTLPANRLQEDTLFGVLFITFRSGGISFCFCISTGCCSQTNPAPPPAGYLTCFGGFTKSFSAGTISDGGGEDSGAYTMLP